MLPAISNTPTPTVPDVADSATETELLVWQVHRLRDEPERIPLIAGAFAATVAVWWLVLPNIALVPIPLICLTAALSDFLFPIRFRITDRGAHSGCGLSQLFINWSDVKRATRGKDGIYLSPFPRPSRLEAFRGVRLRFADNQEAVTTLVRERWRSESGGNA